MDQPEAIQTWQVQSKNIRCPQTFIGFGELIRPRMKKTPKAVGPQYVGPGVALGVQDTVFPFSKGS